MPVPIAAVVIAGAATAISGRLIKKQLDVHNEQEKLRMKRNTVGLKGSGKAMAKKVYK